MGLKRRTFSRYKYAEEFCYELNRKRVQWQMTSVFDVNHFDDDDDEPYVYDDFIVDYWEPEE